ncbi:TauD/TfdA family dioxygenase [Streptomyces sp. NPDC058953]|uniref:TauD/TfdA family dioxygenase n=1 Tax=unclassified Streptomyces TaxID=2593676 RepID=UPI00367C53E9
MSVATTPVFTPHDVKHPSSMPAVLAQLRTHGMVLLDGMPTRSDVLTAAGRILVPWPHPDSGPDGLTAIQHVVRHHGRPGYAGFGTAALDPHSERAQTTKPPRLMLMACQKAADTGGECLLADGREVLGALSAEAVEQFFRPGSVYYGTSSGHASQVFTRHPGGRVSIRLRFDRLAHWSPPTEPHLDDLRAAIAAAQHRVALSAGQAYLIDNHRWLHARTEFSGDRRFLRALGVPRFAMAEGFPGLPPAEPERAGLPRVCGGAVSPDLPPRDRPAPEGPIVTVPLSPLVQATIDRIRAASRAAARG